MVPSLSFLRLRTSLSDADLVLDAQPPAQPHSGVIVDRPIRFVNSTNAEVVGPPQGARPVPRGHPDGHRWPHLGASRVAYAFLVYMLSPLPRRSGWAYSSLCFTQPYQPSPKGLSGRPAHCPFRGLLSVHSRYGLHTRAVTNS